ncbi:hypothetical protein OOT33_03965 [Sphingobium sp. DEHP117]|uniref:DUF3617 domain-containing protein n=1 Tax=Sphingobium sp. DEHP117 TaxID=2993436 RepID=UPI0027D48758|nr:hypothetical protein [Sphingobium sp. DEHP117]MDQ4419596.1 hypothetical protein [Sphingobium sp. DEHP117]
MDIWVRFAAAAALSMWGTAALAVSAGGPAPSAGRMTALRQIEKGQWELRERGTKQPAAPRRLCVGDPAQLLQVQHGDGGCSRFVVADTDNHAIVTYQCNGRGNGRTDLRVETPRLIQIDSQGVADGAPFAVSLEGRRTGECR